MSYVRHRHGWLRPDFIHFFLVLILFWVSLQAPVIKWTKTTQNCVSLSVHMSSLEPLALHRLAQCLKYLQRRAVVAVHMWGLPKTRDADRSARKTNFLSMNPRPPKNALLSPLFKSSGLPNQFYACLCYIDLTMKIHFNWKYN